MSYPVGAECAEEIARLRAENEALREALLYIRDYSDDPHVVRQAKAALAGREE